jgi:PAS domain S-box-containing protein
LKTLFSFHTPIAAFAAQVDSANVIIREGRMEGVMTENGVMLSAIPVPGSCPIMEACRKLVQQPQNACLVTMDENDQPSGIVTLQRLLAVVTEICGHQAVLLETLLDTMSEATTVVDKTNTVQYWNQAAEKIYEISRENVIGTSLETHFASESIRLKDALAQGTTVQRVYHVPRPDRHVLINSAPIRLDGEIIGAISIEQDITELVRLNQELADTTAHLHTLKQEMNRFQAADDPFYAIKGHSASIQTAIQAAKKVATTDATVLLYGESGVGKELFAQAIHQASRRHEKPFIAINCAAIPAALFESELFGYQGGAFTGAEKKGKPGKLELAHGGTLFLDEIGELPLELQVKLLRALQERQFYRVGGTDPITVNTRIIAATNRNLEQMVAEGRFREDLYYRLNVFSLEIPPLRERKEDILELVQIFIQEYSVTHGQPVPRISPEVMQTLFDYSWPGNIRQLRNVIERLFILQEGGVILLDHLPATIRLDTATPMYEQRTPAIIPRPIANGLGEAKMPERERILAALDRTYGNKKAAAEMLGISRGTLYNKMRKYGILDGE